MLTSSLDFRTATIARHDHNETFDQQASGLGFNHLRLAMERRPWESSRVLQVVSVLVRQPLSNVSGCQTDTKQSDRPGGAWLGHRGCRN